MNWLEDIALSPQPGEVANRKGSDIAWTPQDAARAAEYQPAPCSETFPEVCYERVIPQIFSGTSPQYVNYALGSSLGLASYLVDNLEKHFAHFNPLPGNLRSAMALRYHGQQISHYNHEIGDGRSFLFAQVRDHTGKRVDLGSKGAGRTPWSRGGDGRLSLKEAFQELCISEILADLEVPSSRVLCVFQTPDQVFRLDEPIPSRSAFLVRTMACPFRIGTFQALGYLGDRLALRKLVEFTAEHYLDVHGSDSPAASLLSYSTVAIARLAGAWASVGFFHGRPSTDNTSILGEGLDYGTGRFLDHIVWGNRIRRRLEVGQVDTLLWNLKRFQELLQLVEPSVGKVEIETTFRKEVEHARTLGALRRLRMQGSAMADGHQIRQLLEEGLVERRLSSARFYAAWERTLGVGVQDDSEDREALTLAETLFSRFRRHVHPTTPAMKLISPPRKAKLALLWEAAREVSNWSVFGLTKALRSTRPA